MDSACIVLASQIFTVPSQLAVNNVAPVRSNAAPSMGLVWPASVNSRRPDLASQTLAVESALAVAIRSPSGVNPAQKTVFV